MSNGLLMKEYNRLSEYLKMNGEELGIDVAGIGKIIQTLYKYKLIKNLEQLIPYAYVYFLAKRNAIDDSFDYDNENYLVDFLTLLCDFLQFTYSIKLKGVKGGK